MPETLEQMRERKWEEKAAILRIDEMHVCNFMPHHTGYPNLSRDWEDIDCKAKSCVHNFFDKCQVSSKAVIDDEGHCKGFKAKVMEPAKDKDSMLPEGD